MTDLNEIINEIINDDYNKFLNNIYTKFEKDIPISSDIFINNYSLNKLIFVPEKPKKKYNKKKISQSDRCMARTWGGKGSVKYDSINKLWNYGYQCSRKKNNCDYCTLHYQQTLRPSGLSHGRIDGPVPHNHYLKYKLSIIKNK